MKALITKTGSTDFTLFADNCEYVGKIKGNFRIKGIRSTNPLTVGDWVEFDPISGYITELYERRNYIVRRPTNLSKQLHIIGANIDQALLVVTLREPETDLGFIDRFLVTARAYRIPVIIAFNKIDLLSADETTYLEALENLYQGIGHKTIRLRASDNNFAMDELYRLLEGKITLLSGNSGVGKSTIINRLVPNAQTRTGEISQSHHKGMHTTTFSQMYPLPDWRNQNCQLSIVNCQFLIDTPGIKGFGVVDMKPEEISHYFPEIFHYAKNCRFSDCTHTNEPGCAVVEALNNHLIAQSRYLNYLAIRADLSDGKYRK